MSACYKPCQELCCPANAWSEHFGMHDTACASGMACPALTCMHEHSVSNNYLFHAIKHFADVPSPEKLLQVLMQRPWLPSAYSEALVRLWAVRKSRGSQHFSITTTTKLLLASAPAGTWTAQSLTPTLALACLPESTLDAASHKEALGLLLAAPQEPWQQQQLSEVITAALKARLPASSTTASSSPDGGLDERAKQKDIIAMLLDHAWPTPGATQHPTAWLHQHIQTAVLSGADPSILELLLGRAPHWRPDDMRENARPGLWLPTWVRTCQSYRANFQIIVRAAAARGVLRQLLPVVSYLVQPFQRGCIENKHGYLDRLAVLLKALAAPDLAGYCSPEDMLQLVQEAAATRNVVLLGYLCAASSRFRWPAAQLSPLLINMAGGAAEYDVQTAAQLLLLASDGWQATALCSAVAAAAERARASPAVEAKGVTRRMCDVLCSNRWQVVAAAAVPLKLPAVVELLARLYGNGSNNGQQQQQLAMMPVGLIGAAVQQVTSPALSSSGPTNHQQLLQEDAAAPTNTVLQPQAAPAVAAAAAAASASASAANNKVPAVAGKLDQQQQGQRQAGQAVVVQGGKQVITSTSKQQQQQPQDEAAAAAEAMAAETLALLKGYAGMHGYQPLPPAAASLMMPPPAAVPLAAAAAAGGGGSAAASATASSRPGAASSSKAALHVPVQAATVLKRQQQQQQQQQDQRPAGPVPVPFHMQQMLMQQLMKIGPDLAAAMEQQQQQQQAQLLSQGRAAAQQQMQQLLQQQRRDQQQQQQPEGRQQLGVQVARKEGMRPVGVVLDLGGAPPKGQQVGVQVASKERVWPVGTKLDLGTAQQQQQGQQQRQGQQVGVQMASNKSWGQVGLKPGVGTAQQQQQQRQQQGQQVASTERQGPVGVKLGLGAAQQQQGQQVGVQVASKEKVGPVEVKCEPEAAQQGQQGQQAGSQVAGGSEREAKRQRMNAPV